jgi:hypothetical protein
MRKFNPYRQFAQDGKALSQVKCLPIVTYTQCTRCRKNIKDGTQKMVNLHCEDCQKREN